MPGLAVEKLHSTDGVTCPYRTDEILDELRETGGYTFAIVTLSFPVGHRVTLLEITAAEVVVRDPLGGKKRHSREESRARWRRIVPVVGRDEN